jgi:L-ascorbate metabolism protein UlaG (beta-lactamase superfamily)
MQPRLEVRDAGIERARHTAAPLRGRRDATMSHLLMTSTCLVFAACSAPAAPPAAAAREPPQGSALTIIYVANDGFLITAGGRAVLVDALFRPRPGGSVARPGDALIAQMTQGAPPFARIDALLVSHDHQDHFDPALVQAFLARHPETTLVSTGAICAAVAATGGPAARMRRIKIDLGASAVESVAGMSVKAARVKHQGEPGVGGGLLGGTRTENLAWLVTIDGRKILHVGDAITDLNVETYRRLGLPAERIDVLFLEYFDFSGATAAFVKNELKPRYIVAMHVPTTRYEKDLAKFRKTYPDTIVFTKPLEARTLN